MCRLKSDKALRAAQELTEFGLVCERLQVGCALWEAANAQPRPNLMFKQAGLACSLLA